MSKIALLHGAGLDSTALFLDMIKKGIQFDCLHFDYEHVAADAERENIRDQCKKYNIPLIRQHTSTVSKLNTGLNCMLFSGDHSHTPVVEGRNMALIMEAVAMGYDTIYVGIDKPASGKAWGDASKVFIQTMNDLFTMSFMQREVKVIAPFIDRDKEEVFKDAVAFDPEFFQMSMTCWTPVSSVQGCGKCKHCLLEVEYKAKV